MTPSFPLFRRLALCLVMLGVLNACSGQGGRHQARYSPAGRYYPPPGPADDPWGPYVVRAAARFGVPDTWIREVMRRESGGRATVTSGAGAMGLMQVMPGTYAELQVRHNLGDDPYEPLNNILAGAAYIREMYDRYGAPGFLAAYNAGPRRLDDYLSSRRDLPDETINYVAAIAPRLGASTPLSGPLAVYGDGGAAAAIATVASASTADGCDPDAAYDPTRVCRVGGSIGYAPPAASVVPSAAPSGPCDPDAAYDPTRPCTPALADAPIRQDVLAPPAPTLVAAAPPSASTWAVQVGAFSTSVTARLAAERARSTAPASLQQARIELNPTAPGGLYRARLTGLSANQAADACASLSRSSLACVVVRPAGEQSW